MEQSRPRLMLIDDDQDLLDVLKDFFIGKGLRVQAFTEPEKAFQELSQANATDIVIADWSLPGMNGLAFTQKAKEVNPSIPIILITSKQSSELALKAVDAGAYDFLLKPLHPPQLWMSVQRALRWRSLEGENQTLKSVVGINKGDMDGVIIRSEAFHRVVELARRIAKTASTVLVTGESGSGKEILAKAVHRFSPRREHPFVAINCSAIPESLLESELFGFAKGAFTGAYDKKLGLFEEANKGTLFLDEIGDLSLSLQAKLLRVLQDRTIKRVGENQYRAIDVRVIAATHKNLIEEVREKRFREDLFFRLNVIPIAVPPLRDRRDDIWPLAEFFTRKFSVLNGVSIKSWSQQAVSMIMSYAWPGNVRELENAVERAVAFCEGDEIRSEHLMFQEGLSVDSSLHPMMSLERKGGFNQTELCPLDELVKKYIEFALDKNGGAKEATAKMLGIDRKTLYRKIKEMEKESNIL